MIISFSPALNSNICRINFSFELLLHLPPPLSSFCPSSGTVYFSSFLFGVFFGFNLFYTCILDAHYYTFHLLDSFRLSITVYICECIFLFIPFISIGLCYIIPFSYYAFFGLPCFYFKNVLKSFPLSRHARICMCGYGPLFRLILFFLK